MFLSLRQPSIVDARMQAAISNARSQNGVHIYFNEPHTKQGNTFNTTLADMAATRSTYLTWTSMYRAKEDNASFALDLGVDGANAALSNGFIKKYGRYFASRWESGTWGGQKYYSTAPLKKGQYVVLALHIQYPQGTIVAPIKVEINGVEQAEPLTFPTIQNFSKLGSTINQHKNEFTHIEMLETHFLYTGITEGLPPRASPTAYISLENANLAYVTQWDTVEIKGQYTALNQTYKGILVGVNAAGKSAAFYDIESYQGDNATVTIRLTVGFNNVAVSTDKEHRVLNIEIGPDDNAWLLVDNINISNLQIHTTAKIEK